MNNYDAKKLGAVVSTDTMAPTLSPCFRSRDNGRPSFRRLRLRTTRNAGGRIRLLGNLICTGHKQAQSWPSCLPEPARRCSLTSSDSICPFGIWHRSVNERSTRLRHCVGRRHLTFSDGAFDSSIGQESGIIALICDARNEKIGMCF